MWKHARRRRVPIAMTVAAAAVATGIAFAGGAPAAHAAAGCIVTYQANQWTGGFTAAVRVTTGDAVNGWTVTWNYGAADQRVSNAWNATVTQSGTTVTARNVAWNGQLAAGGSTEFGLQGTFGSANPAPTGFTVNGVACNGPVPPSTPGNTPPSSTPPISVPPSSTVPSSTPPSSVPPSSRPPVSNPPSSAPPSTQPGGGCGSAAFCDGFENQTSTVPSGTWGLSYPDCQGTGTASIDSAVAHSGSRSVKVAGTAGYCNHVFVKSTRDFSTLGAVRYGRFWVRHTTALPPQHVTFLAQRDANDGGRDLRMGGQNSALQWNRGSDDATLPEQSPAGVALSTPLPVNRWTCIEFMVDGNQGRLQTWVDGTSVTGLQADGTATHDIDGQWTKPTWKPNLTDLKIGWESYGDGSDTLWFDDVAIGTSKIGC